MIVGVTIAYCTALVILAFVPWSQGTACPWYVAWLSAMPLGVLLGLVVGQRRWWAAMAFGALGVAWLEAAQTIWMPAGYGRIDDVAWGSIGVVAGVLLALVARRFMHSHSPLRMVTEAGGREIPQD